MHRARGNNWSYWSRNVTGRFCYCNKAVIYWFDASSLCPVFQDVKEDESEANVEGEEGHTSNTSQDPEDLCCSSRDTYKTGLDIT